VRYCVLGPLEAFGADGEPLALGSPRQRAMLGVLLTEANRVVAVDRLWDCFGTVRRRARRTPPSRRTSPACGASSNRSGGHRREPDAGAGRLFEAVEGLLAGLTAARWHFPFIEQPERCTRLVVPFVQGASVT
jgi:hypothetical protein